MTKLPDIANPGPTLHDLKLFIWDLDETLLRGVFAEGDREINHAAASLLERLHDRGALQALATQNEQEVAAEAASHYGWDGVFQLTKGDFSPKRTKIVGILEDLKVSADHAVFVDNDPFERDLMAVQIPELTVWSVLQLEAYVDSLRGPVTAEARRRPAMYRVIQEQKSDEEIAEDLDDFLSECGIRVVVRPYDPADEERVVELLLRTNRMNLGEPAAPRQVVAAAMGDGPSRLVIAELRDRYGDSGRCGLIRLTPGTEGEASIDSIAISCRARARGLSLALLMGMLRHPIARFEKYRCVFHSTGRNRPLRMLLWAAGFSPVPRSEVLCTDRCSLEAVEIPSWVRIENLAEGVDAFGEVSGSRSRS